jgi:hypothetical protein
MHARRDGKGLWVLFAATVGIVLPLPFLSAQVPPGPPPPKVSFVLKERHGHATPTRTTAAHTAGSGIEVAQPRDDTLVITMTGVVTAGPHPFKDSAADIDFDLNQDFEIGFSDPKVKQAKLTVEAQIIGLLRGDKDGGSAEVSSGTVALASGSSHNLGLLALVIEGHSVDGGHNLAINDHKGPASIPVLPGEYHLVQSFRINAAHARGICGKGAAAEFAPDPALDPTWISTPDPFRGTNKKEFGFRVTLRVEPE